MPRPTNCALEESWNSAPSRVWVYTCTEDHPAALPNYQARGMTIFKVETRGWMLRGSFQHDESF